MHVNLGYIAPLFVLLFIVYLYCNIKLYYIISAEHPEWLTYGKGRDLLYFGFPRILSTLIIVRVIEIAFSAKASQLIAPKAYTYSMVLRVIIISGMLFFFGVLIFPYL